MNMREAFKALLDGERITRDEWCPGTYIEYDKDNNVFKLICRNTFYEGVDECPIWGADKESNKHIIITSHSKNGDEWIVYILDDDKNKIYISKEEQMELDAMKWRIEGFGEDDDCENCILADNEYCLCDPFPCKRDYLEKATPTKIREIYELIKE